METMTLDEAKKSRIDWEWDHEKHLPYPIETYPLKNELLEVIGFPQPWLDRPWIFANMVSSLNGIVAWMRANKKDNPLEVIIGDRNTTEARADLWLMRYLRTFGDMSIGSQTTREQPKAIQTPQEDWERKKHYPQVIYQELYGARSKRELPMHPRNIIYSASGNLRFGKENVVFDTTGLRVIVITTKQGAQELQKRGVAEKKNVSLLIEGETELDAAALIRAHQRLFSEFGVRYLNCEGGDSILRSLHAAGILDEVFVTTSDIVINETAHEDLKYIFDFKKEKAVHIAHGKIGPESPFNFDRWRFNQR